jgi:mono/diheme cytochrome c family protein
LRILKWVGITLGAIVAVLVVAVAALYMVGTLRLNRTYEFQVEALRAPTDAGSIARGKHIVEAIGGCQECHGEGLSGQIIEDDPAFARLVASNLTPGQGGIGGRYTDVDYVRAIRHGVRPNGGRLSLCLPRSSIITATRI